jgi:pyridoxal 5'-phosphate synthase pdxT subunit
VAGKPAGVPDTARAAGEDAQAPRIGVLAVQGDFEAHAKALERLGCEALEVRRPAQLASLDGLIVPGGESTTISKGIATYGLEQPIREFARAGRPLLGTCAGLIMADRDHLGLIDIVARRNAFGRQVKSFEADLQVRGLGDEPVRAVFIRAPWIESHGAGVEVLAEIEGHPVVAREGNVLVAAFHPELTDDLRMHALFCAMTKVGERVGTTRGAAAAEGGARDSHDFRGASEASGLL